MTRVKYPKSEADAQAAIIDSKEPAYFSLKDPNASEFSSKALAEYTGIQRSTADARFVDFSNLLPGISGRPGLTRTAYNYFRPDEATPNAYREIILRCNSIYHQVGLVRNIIDLMGDFGSKGIQLCHTNKRQQKFYRHWWKKVNGTERSERFLNYLYRTGNVVIKRQTATINMQVRERMYKTYADADMEVEPFKFTRGEIPWMYTFIDPSITYIIGGALASFVGQPQYGIRIPDKLRRTILSPKNTEERALVQQLPDDIVKAAQANRLYPLDPDKTSVFHYKKDDWDSWAVPMIYAIIKDAVMLDKLKLADSAALDGAISNVRIFKVGNLDHDIAPTAYATAKIANILQNNVGGGTIDIVWGPDIELIESKTTIHQFLGEEKYKPVLNAIYAGLGIPPTLTGTFGAAGTTNNYISLKTLTERLEYGRNLLTAFWEKEVAIVQKAMGFKTPPTIEYDIMALANEEAIKQLYINLADRNVISDETLQAIFGQDPDMEKNRIKKEAKARESGKMVNKAGPFYQPQLEEQLKSAALTSGIAAPSQVGLDLPEKKPGEMNGMDYKLQVSKQKKKAAKAKGQPGQGRPKNKKDSQKRKTKTFTPRSKAVEIWATKAQAEIADLLNPMFLETYGKKNMRSLTSSEFSEAETIKFGVLCNLEPMSNVTLESIASVLDKATVPIEVNNNIQTMVASIGTTVNLSIEDHRAIQAYAYMQYKETNNE